MGTSGLEQEVAGTTHKITKPKKDSVFAGKQESLALTLHERLLRNTNSSTY